MKFLDLFDLIGFIHKQKLPLITQYTLPDGYQVFEFSTLGTDMVWKAGQHGFFTIPETKITGTTWRAFSVASIPSENKILIATRIPPEPSSFKQALLALKPGDMITMRGPYGWLYYKDATSPAVMIAGGVGITPFRAMLKEVAGGTNRTTHLIYSAQGIPPFKDELDQIVQKVPAVSIVYTSTIEDTTAKITDAVNEFGNSAYYFISGAPGMIEGVKTNLMKQGIASRRIVTDAFRGYQQATSGQPKK